MQSGFQNAWGNVMRIPAGLSSLLGWLVLTGSVGAWSMADVGFTAAQATAGEVAYQQACLSCHQPGGGNGVVPVLINESFMTRWSGRPASDLFNAIKRMPPGGGGSLGDITYTNILAHLLNSNGVAAGDRQLPNDAAALATLRFPVAENSVDTATVIGSGEQPLLKALTPVTDSVLASPSAADWLSWGRTHDKTGFSPLQQINRKTVARLKPEWNLPLAGGNNNPTPLVHDGVMFLYSFPDTVMALDASSGELLWRHRYEPVGVASSRKMGIALGGDKVFVPTSDMRMLALDARTGRKVWDRAITYDKTLTGGFARYDLRAAPIVADGKVIMGTVSSVVPTGGFIFALDAESGKEVWRFRTIAQPGTADGNSWNGLSAQERSGGSVWISGSYDVELGLVYFGVAPTYDVQPFYEPSADPTQSREAKYTNSTVALDVRTGELRWSYSHHILDHWDLDWAFERQLVELEFKGEQRRAIATVSKGALLDALDATTGEYLFSVEMGIHTTISAIDPTTGMKTNNPDTEPGREGSYLVCPTAFGARSWTPTSYDAKSKLLYQPFIEACITAGDVGYPMLMTGVNAMAAAWPQSKGKMGRLHAIDLEKGETRWLHRQVTPIVSSTLATAGGLVFVGDLDPSLKAFDALSGEVVWQAALPDDPSSSIISYAVDGRQYLAVVVGQSNNHHRDWKNYYRTISEAEGWDRPTEKEGEGPSIRVFALGD
jgi:alcohol dehydrogenase (cytochrome c)